MRLFVVLLFSLPTICLASKTGCDPDAHLAANSEITLRNGSTYQASLVAAVHLGLDKMAKSENLVDVTTLYELVMIARDPNYRPSDDARERLEDLGYLSRQGTIHQVVRDVALSMAEDDGADMVFRSPVKR